MIFRATLSRDGSGSRNRASIARVRSRMDMNLYSRSR
uniref:Uncharacterized protein n=1 Tax=Utricularia reniformis TaxID=192314 RepID=A0A1Y0B4E7_9LAMI|nr:hypothetical protein AEK19_MT2111 [Utricularia reniformis]ART32264.1 hypothetical protein AEK19_MT2111 [Utricularia reniformis]